MTYLDSHVVLFSNHSIEPNLEFDFSLNPVPGSQFLIPSSQLGAYQTATPVSSVSGQALTAGPGQQLMQTSTGQILQMSMNEMPSQRLIRRGHQMELMGQAKVSNNTLSSSTQGLIFQHVPGLATNSIFFCFLFVKTPLTPNRGNTILFRSSQQPPRLRLGPSKGFLS